MGRLLFTSQIYYGLGGSMSEVVGLSNNSYKPIINDIDFLPLSMIFRLHFGTVLTIMRAVVAVIAW